MLCTNGNMHFGATLLKSFVCIFMKGQ